MRRKRTLRLDRGERHKSGHVKSSTEALTSSCALMYSFHMKQGKTYTKNKHAQALGRLGGLKGGKARAASLPPEERSAIARKAVMARWAKTHREKAKSKGESKS